MPNLGDQFTQLLEQVQQEEQTRKDIIMPLNELHMDESGLVTGHGFEKMELGDSAMSQICSSLRLPTEYMKRLQNERPDLVASQVNYFLQSRNSKGNRKVRIKNNRIQGFVGDKYVPFDNLDFLNVFHDSVKGMDGLSVKHFDVNDRKFHMRVVFDSKSVDFGNDIQGVRDDIFLGFDLENSEIGYRSINLTPVVWRLVCTNGMRRVFARGEVLKQRHSNFDTVMLRDRMEKSIHDSMEFGVEMINALAVSRSVKITDTSAKIEEVGKLYNVPNKDIEMAKRNFQFDPEHSMYGVLNAYTRTARDMKDNERRVNMETVAGEILTKIS